MADSAHPLLALRGVSKRYGSIAALTDVDLEVHAGRVVALVGDNGAGKSTLVKGLSGTAPFDSGTITIDTETVRISSPGDAAKHGIETVYQDLALCDNLSVVANLYLGRELRHHGLMSWAQMQANAERVVRDLRLTLPDVHRPVAALSGGQRQAVAVSRAVLWGSRVVVMDEPTAALGVEQTAMVYRLIGSLRERGMGVVLVSHNLADVFAVADDVTVLRLGRNAGVFSPAVDRIEDVISAITGGNVIPGAQIA